MADHVVEAVAVGWKRPDRRGARGAVSREVFARKLALPGIGHMTAARGQFVAPGELGPVEAAAGGVLPLGFRRQFLAGPGGVGLSVLVCDMHDGMVVEAVFRAPAAVRPAPVRTELEAPP